MSGEIVASIKVMIAIAEARKAAGCTPFRKCDRLGYAPPAGDGDHENPEHWLTDDERSELHSLRMQIRVGGEAQAARERIRAKIEARNLGRYGV